MAYSRLDRVADRVSAECEHLAISTDALQAEIGRCVESGSFGVDTQAILSLQEVDRISQTLRCLARLVARIAPELEELQIARSELTAEVGLESVSHRLLGD